VRLGPAIQNGNILPRGLRQNIKLTRHRSGAQLVQLFFEKGPITIAQVTHRQHILPQQGQRPRHIRRLARRNPRYLPSRVDLSGYKALAPHHTINGWIQSDGNKTLGYHESIL
jgi:hypothetical protein